MPLYIIRDDVTKIMCDAIVNPTNEDLLPNGGADLAIHTAAGSELIRECRRIGHLDVGDAAITPGFNLPSKYVIHTVGPIWQGLDSDEVLLAACYRRVIRLAVSHRCKSIAIPLISAGLNGFPKDRVLRLASEVISKMLALIEMEVYLVLYDGCDFEIPSDRLEDLHRYLGARGAFRAAPESVREDEYPILESHSVCLGAVRKTGSYDFREDASCEWEGDEEDIDEAREEKSDKSGEEDTDDESNAEYFRRSAAEKTRTKTRSETPGSPEKADTPPTHRAVSSKSFFIGCAPRASSHKTLDDYLRQLDRGFADTLFYYIDERKISDVECYKRSNVSKKTFSKIKCNKLYRPSKVTAVSFAIGLRLSLEETQHLLSTAGLCLSDSYEFDLIIKYFLTTGDYKDIFEVNEVLYKFDQPLLGV